MISLKQMINSLLLTPRFAKRPNTHKHTNTSQGNTMNRNSKALCKANRIAMHDARLRSSMFICSVIIRQNIEQLGCWCCIY